MVARDLKGSLVRPVPVQVFLEALQVPLKTRVGSAESGSSKLDRQMADLVNRLKTFTNAVGVRSGLTKDADDSRMGLRPNLPDM